MNLRELEVYYTICEEESFTRAAERLCMTQPAVSHVVRALEIETGTRLFERMGRRICLTESGRLFLEKAMSVLEAYKELREEMKKAEEKTPLRLGSSITIANTWLPQAMVEFEKRWPQTPVKVTIASAASVEKSLRNNDLDMAFVEGEIDKREWNACCVSSYEMAFFCSPEHPFADRQEVGAEELVSERLILREKGSAIRDTLDSALRLLHIVLEPAWTSTNSQAILQAVKHNLGVSLLPLSLLEKEFYAGGLKPFRVKDMELVNQNHIVTRRDKYWTAPMKGMASIVQEPSSARD